MLVIVLSVLLFDTRGHLSLHSRCVLLNIQRIQNFSEGSIIKKTILLSPDWQFSVNTAVNWSHCNWDQCVICDISVKISIKATWICGNMNFIKGYCYLHVIWLLFFNHTLLFSQVNNMISDQNGLFPCWKCHTIIQL